jgi:hypothetical protein
MITIGYSTRISNPQFQEYLKKSSGHPKVQVIEKITNGEKNLSQVYNEILEESIFDVVILCHDDIYFDTTNWCSKITKHFERSDYSILGVAGTTFMPKSGMWWEDRSKMYGVVNHESNGKKWESKYSDSLQNNIKEVILVDGVFMVIHKKRIKSKFDESVEGFHMYDINFCFKNYLDNAKIGVITNVRLTHKSIGMTNESWEKNRKIFSEKYSSDLPAHLNYSTDDSLFILFSIEKLDVVSESGKFIINFLEKFSKEYKIKVLLGDINKDVSKVLSKFDIQILDFKNVPGYKLGDGKSKIMTQNGPEIMKQNLYYKTSEEKIDLILILGSEVNRIMSMLYPLTKKIFLPSQELNNIKNFIDNEKIIKILSESGSELLNQFNNTNKIQNTYDFELSKENLCSILNQNLSKINDKQKVKILTGFSEKGGSTTSFINLTNALNENNFDCTLFGPHTWHLDKCKSGMLNNVTFEDTDIVICHFLDLQQRPNASKVFLSCHEKNLFKVGEKKQYWDKAVFLNQTHRDYHSSYEGQYEIIPNLKENLLPSNKKGIEKIAGVIGSIDRNKQTHVSIQRAIKDNCEKIYIFGQVTDNNYFENDVKPLIDNITVVFYGVHNNKQEMYDMIGRVYQSSLSECASLVKDECFITQTEFYGNQNINHDTTNLNNNEILNKWIKLFTE